MTTRSLFLGFLVLAPVQPAAALSPYMDRPRVEVWTSRGDDVVHRGDRLRVFVRADRDGFVTVFRVDTDGRVRVLFPRDPWEDTFARRGREYEIAGGDGRHSFFVDDYPGVGYLFAVVAVDPFDYNAIVTGDHWDYRVIADGRVRGDPYVALTDLAARIVPEGYTEWDYDLVPYYVERHYEYPRFACYDCHAYASWTYWDPYAWYCSRFRIVIYNDPWYYPYRYYGRTRVVVVRPYRPPPRYVFKEWGGTSRDRDGFITRIRQRLSPEERGRAVYEGPRNIPVPRSREADRTASPDRPSRVEQDRREAPSRVEAPRRADPRSREADRPKDLERIERGGVAEPRRGVSSDRDRPDGGLVEHRDVRSQRPDVRSQGTAQSEPKETERRAQGANDRADRSRSERPEARPQTTGRGGEERRDAPARPQAGGRESGDRPAGRESPRPAPDRSAGRGSPSRPEQSKPELKRRRPD